MSGASAEALRLLGAALDALDDRILLIDRERRVVLANRAFLAECGRSAEEVIGRPYAELRGADGAGLVEAVFAGEGPQRLVEDIEAEDGPRRIERRVSALADAEGGVTHALERIRDISAERRLAETPKTVRALLHDINNLLFVALGTTELMADDAENAEGGRRAPEYAALLRNLRRIADITRATREQIAAAQERGWYGRGE